MTHTFMTRRGVIFLLVFAFMFLAMQQAQACTGIALKNADGTVVHGRTLEFGAVVDSSIAFVPRNHEFTGAVPGGKGMNYTSKYAILGSVSFDTLAVMDGINEQGLSVGAFYFPTFAGYGTLTEANRSIALSPVDFPNWILAEFSTLAEVRAAVESGKACIVPTVVNGWGPAAPPLHYIVYDRAGKSLVLEPVDGKIKIYDNPIGAITNSPSFDWQMTNLRNYINLSPYNAAPMSVNCINLLPFGQGTGMYGLPGDYTPPSRFVRAALFSINAVPSPDATQGIYQVFHILNNFDIPYGSTREGTKAKYGCDYTQFTAARDPQSLRYYFKSYADQTIRMIDMKKFDFKSTSAVSVNVMGFKQSPVDITTQLKPVK
jgi:choloylglycine hydrolase